MRRVITLLSDFGTQDGYVAQMKASVLATCNDCHLVDVTHEIPPQDIATASRVLHRTAFRFPPGSVHVAVVDPGVGTERQVIAASIGSHYFVAPDNGLLTDILGDHSVDEVVRVEHTTAESCTFHGRDVMAPAAAQIATGQSLQSIGNAVETDLVVLQQPEPVVRETAIETSVSTVDHFGNASLLGCEELAAWLQDAVEKRLSLRLLRKDSSSGGDQADEGLAVHCCSTYGEKNPGECVLLKGSQYDFEIAIVNGSAADQLNLHIGQPLTLTIE
ncbi:MAG: hypothetical protein Aurels2KO_16400 [Aureliella sp.]